VESSKGTWTIVVYTMLENFAKLQFIIHISNTQTNKVINRKKMQLLITFVW
jgi:hypothetical protein